MKKIDKKTNMNWKTRDEDGQGQKWSDEEINGQPADQEQMTSKTTNPQHIFFSLHFFSTNRDGVKYGAIFAIILISPLSFVSPFQW